MSEADNNRPTAKYRDIHLVEEKYKFSKLEWKVQKVCKIILTLFLIAGLVGLFGGGLIGRRIAEGNHFKVEYAWMAREESPAKLYIYLKDPSDVTKVSFNNSYLTDVRITQTMPTAVSSKTTTRQMTYKFNTEGSGVIIIYTVADNAGLKQLDIEVGDETIHLKQFVYF